MKNVIYLSLLVALFAAACSSNKNGIITKRKYTKGYYVDIKGRNKHNVKENETAVANAKKVSPAKHNALKVVSENNLVNNETEGTNSNNNNQSSALTAAVVSHQSSKKVNGTKTMVASNDKISTPIFTAPKFKDVMIAKRAIKKEITKGKADDTNLIIMVILCLFPFINLIPVYMHDSKALTMNFWITLILDCLFFLPGIIFSLLVVLDVVNLA